MTSHDSGLSTISRTPVPSRSNARLDQSADAAPSRLVTNRVPCVGLDASVTCASSTAAIPATTVRP